MRLIIDIPEDIYNACKDFRWANRLEKIVANGTPIELTEKGAENGNTEKNEGN